MAAVPTPGFLHLHVQVCVLVFVTLRCLLLLTPFAAHQLRLQVGVRVTATSVAHPLFTVRARPCRRCLCASHANLSHPTASFLLHQQMHLTV